MPKSTSRRVRTGTTKAVIAHEIASAAAIVIDSALENAPVTPVKNASGRKTISVARLDPVSGFRNSRAAGSTAAEVMPPPSPRSAAKVAATKAGRSKRGRSNMAGGPSKLKKQKNLT